MFSFVKLFQAFSKLAAPLCISTAVNEHSYCSLSSPEFGAVSILDFHHSNRCVVGFPAGSDSKESACNSGDLYLIPGLGRSPEEGNGNPLQYSCLENPMRRGAWEAIVHGVTRFGHDLATIPPPWACFTVVSVIKRASLVAQMVMSQPAIQET